MSGAELALLLPALEGTGAAAGAGLGAEALGAGTGLGAAFGGSAAASPLAGALLGSAGATPFFTEAALGASLPGMTAAGIPGGISGLFGSGASAIPELGAFGLGAPGPAAGPSMFDKFMGGVDKMGKGMAAANAAKGLLGGDNPPPQAPPMPAPQPQQGQSLMSVLQGHGFNGTTAPNAKLKFGMEARKMGMTPEQLMAMMQGRMA